MSKKFWVLFIVSSFVVFELTLLFIVPPVVTYLTNLGLGKGFLETTNLPDKNNEAFAPYPVIAYSLPANSLPNIAPFIKGTSSEPASVFDVSHDKNDNIFLIDFLMFWDSIFHGNPSKKSWDLWNRADYYFLSDIIEVDREHGVLVLNIVEPSNRSFSKIRKTVTASCDAKNSIEISSKNLEMLKESVDIFSEAKVGDGFFSYCLDEECNKVGNSCVLVKYDKIE
jgi:hypothetical protein